MFIFFQTLLTEGLFNQCSRCIPKEKVAALLLFLIQNALVVTFGVLHILHDVVKGHWDEPASSSIMGVHPLGTRFHSVNSLSRPGKFRERRKRATLEVQRAVRSQQILPGASS